MENLNKDTLILLAMELNYSDILNFCQTNKKINRYVCKNIDFWRNKLYLTYPLAKNIESKDYEKIYRYIEMGKKILDNIPENVNFSGRGFDRVRIIKPEMVNFLLNANLGDYNGVPLNYILFPILEKRISNMNLITRILSIYLVKNMFIENGGKYYRAGPEMNLYLGVQLTELENTGKFNRNKFVFNQIIKNLINVCKVNKKAKEYCNDQNFWLKRITIKFPYVSTEMLNKYKGNRTWSDYYIHDLRKVGKSGDIKSEVLNASKYGRLDQLFILKKLGIRVNIPIAIRLAAMHHHQDVVDYFNSLPPSYL